MPGSVNPQSDNNGIAIFTAPPDNPQSAIRNPRSDGPQSVTHNPQSDDPQSAIHNPQPSHFSILQYAQPSEQQVRVKPLPRAFHPQPLNYDRRIWLLAILTGLPGAIVGLTLLWAGDFTPKTQWTLTVLMIRSWFGCAFALREKVTTPLQTLSNLLAALREGDYSIRGRATKKDDPLGDVVREVNALGATLRAQRLGAMEATALARTVMTEIEVAVFAFDGDQRLRLVNRAGERLLDRPAEQLLGRSAEDLRL